MNNKTIFDIISFIGFVIILFICAIAHELGHGYAAYLLGDKTAKDAGRLTLNPIKHVDLFGTILFPIMLKLAGFIPLILFKPVPINPNNFKNPNKDSIKVAFAGPGTNILLILLTIILIRFLNLFDSIRTSEVFLIVKNNILVFFILINLIIAIFNLIPFPPLDGSWILKGVLPEKMRYYFQKYNTYLIIIFLILVLTGQLSFLFRFLLKFFLQVTYFLIG